MNKGKRIIQAALEILEDFLKGVTYSVLCNLIAKRLPDINPNSIPPFVCDLPNSESGKVYKPARGVYCLTKFAEEGRESEKGSPVSATGMPGSEGTPPDGEVPPRGAQGRREELLYPFVADFLCGMDECTSAIPFGGNCFGGRNNTPDVIGVMQPGIGQILDFPIEFISAEVKCSATDAIAGFGQACAYRLFSHKSYLVVPDGEGEEMGRVESLCNLFGIGLIVFPEGDIPSGESGAKTEMPDFKVKTRAVRHSPDMFYFKKYPDKYLREHPDIAAKLLRGEANQDDE